VPSCSGFPVSWRAPPASGTFARLLICVAPPAAAAIGFLMARIDGASQDLVQALKAGATAVFLQSDYTPSQAEKLATLEVASQLEINWWLSLIAALLVAFALIVFAAALIAERRVSFSGRPRHLVWRLLAAMIIAAALSVLFAAYPVAIAQAITPFGIICLFFMVLTLIVAAPNLVSRKWELPAGMLVLFFAAVLSLLGFNDNHRIRTVLASEGESRGQPKPETIAKGFEAWFQERKDKERYAVYPIYIVATEGGGIYAAHRTATFLSDLQDRCPRFSHHLFAVSSVSGGSVGAAIME
jgi:NADH:ubiquinone oxidoreductase subunit 6 (subunit J)